ncbi:MAG: Crp/Fnr family transcriptional regulator [Bacteroidetes bacterium]|nr:Crp/Fnr family transcriptional regulator [Bacteroidota bacterium]
MDKILRIKQSIDSIISLSDEELVILNRSLEFKALKKNELLLTEGQICDFVAFVSQGVLIYSKTTDNGDELTTDFAFEGDWVTYNLSRLKQIPANINIRAIEDTNLFIIKQAVLEDLYIKIPKLERLGRILIEQSFIKIAQHSIDLQVLSAKQRYENLLNEHPDILQKVQLYHIANYLGIAPKSLSRIRKEIFSK